MSNDDFMNGSAWVFASMPLFYAAAAVLMPRLSDMWRYALSASVLALTAVLVASLGLAAGGPSAQVVHVASRLSPVFEVRMDVLTAAMSVLIAFISMIILRYSKSYLAGDSGQARFVRWFFGTVASISLLVASILA